MDVYQYLAQSDPLAAKAICNKFGYRTINIKDKSDLATALRTVVKEVGEPAVKEIMENHPDKEAILDMCSKTTEHFKSADGTSESVKSGCGGCKGCSQSKEKDHYMNATGAGLAGQTNTFIIAAALLLAVAIISKN